MLINQDAAKASGGMPASACRARCRTSGRDGGGIYDNVRQNQWYSYNDQSVGGAYLVHSSRQGGAYVQDEIRVRPWLLLNGGVRFDQYEDFGRATPRAAVIVTPSSGTSFKYLYGQAFRAPNAYELYYYGTTPPDLRRIRQHP